jgi:cytochrome c biogenesis DsbD-like protein/AhpC/TSA family protein
VLAAFAARKAITFPMLADPGSILIRKFRMVDPDNTGNNVPAYGARDTAYPGYFVVNPAGVVTERFVDGRYDDRRTGNAMVSTLFPELLETGGRPIKAPHVQLGLGQTDTAVTLGARLQLLVDLELPRGVHVYAPGVQGYRPIALAFDSSPWFRALPPRYPASRMLELRAIGETVPVYERSARIVTDVIIANTTALMRELGKAPAAPRPVTLAARFQYQACDDKVCYPPAEIPLAWTVTVKLPDRERAVPKGRE